MGWELDHDEEIAEDLAKRRARRALERAAAKPVIDGNGEPRDYPRELAAIARYPGQTGRSGLGFGGTK